MPTDDLAARLHSFERRFDLDMLEIPRSLVAAVRTELLRLDDSIGIARILNNWMTGLIYKNDCYRCPDPYERGGDVSEL